MTKLLHLSAYSGSGSACGDNPDFGYSKRPESVTCHRCLEEFVRFGERSVARIVELDKAADQQPAEPTRPECVCNARFRTAEDYRDHLPCVEELVLVHADGGDCHGVALCSYPDGGKYCPVCRISPDMQSTEFWPKSKIKDDWRTRNLTGDSW